MPGVLSAVVKTAVRLQTATCSPYLATGYQVAPAVMERLDKRAYLDCIARAERACWDARLDVNTASWTQEQLQARREAVADACASPPSWALGAGGEQGGAIAQRPPILSGRVTCARTTRTRPGRALSAGNR